MKRIAAPMVGGVFSSFLMELLVYPAIYEIWKWNFELRPRLDRNRAPAIAKIYDASEETTDLLSAESYQPAPKSTCSTRSDWTVEVTVR